ncbi:MAG: glycosyltransferase family 2 protein [Methanobacteriaceae archaeon]|jgi:GT2 family glycosyltransferase|nr:glycosyltransferase family 2 protein [Methanobacteriaceae archaeon]
MENPQVAIIIVNWNGWEDTIECLESLYRIDYPNYEIIIVDNHSHDDSVKKIKEYSEGKELTIIENEENCGFAEGNNIGIKYALKNFKPKYILLLNNDTVVDKNFLKELITAGEKNTHLGILGPKIYFYDKPEVIWSAGCKISWKFARGIQIGTGEVDKGQYNNPKEVEYVSGSAFLIKTNVIDDIGLMDKDYFLYFEESDWTLRANSAGYKSLYVPSAKIWHKVSKSGGGISKPIGLYYITRNRWIFMKKWAKKGDYAIFIIYQFLGALIFPIILSVYYKNFKLFSAYYKGLNKGINHKYHGRIL